MSDRLYLYDFPVVWGDVNLCECSSMKGALVEVCAAWQFVTVIGPEDRIEECKKVWAEIEADPESKVYVPAISFYVRSAEDMRQLLAAEGDTRHGD